MYPGKISLFASLVILFVAVSPLRAADDVQQLVDELQSLADKSREQRAADRWLQNALEELVSKYKFPWRNSLMTENFSDGDYTQSPTWSVASGEFWIDGRNGLRSAVKAVEVTKEQPQTTQKQSDKDLGRALLGAFLQEALGPQQSAQQSPEPVRETVTVAASIRTRLDIPTTFAVEALFSQNDRPGVPGLLEWTVMQDETAGNAYKLVINIGSKAYIDVVRVRSGRESIIESAEVASLQNRGEHIFSWRQTAEGQIEVYLDGNPIIKTSDKGFRYGFKYLQVSNRMGDFSVAGVEVMGG
jgi:hypothetical protein